MEGFEIPFMCEMLVDQNRYVGDDPVGYRCTQAAAYEAPAGFLLCEGCKEKLDREPHRITLPRPPFGKAYQEELAKKAVEVACDWRNAKWEAAGDKRFIKLEPDGRIYVTGEPKEPA